MRPVFGEARQTLGHPATTRLLERLWPDVEAAIQADAEELHDQIEKPGPRQCCAEYSVVTECDGRTDEMYCGVCEQVWTQPCSVGDFVPAIEV